MTRSVFHRSRGRAAVVVSVIAVLAALAAGLAAVLMTSHRSASAGAALRIAPSTTEPPPFVVAATTPAEGAVNVTSDAAVQVQFSQPVAVGGPVPQFTPAVAGSWSRLDATTLGFTATSPFLPGSDELLTIPGGPAGMRDDAGVALGQSMKVKFSVAASTLRLQQLLAALGYLPVSFTAAGPPPSPNEAAQPQPGDFAWRWSGSLSGLEDHWSAGELGPLTKGAIMTFQDQHGLVVDGLPGSRLWVALLKSASSGSTDPKPYDYVYVSKARPENLTLYVNGMATFSNVLVNTGTPGADTPDGTYPVFEHVTASEMKGRNADGSFYDDKGVPWASYFLGGDALHGFVRASYGSPQSNGCVEMPIATAGAMWPDTPVGTLVTVAGPSA